MKEIVPRKKLIETAYREGERRGLAVWCEDEAGPYQAIPQSGHCWQPTGVPERYPQEYIRGGTAKLLMLFHPATGQVRVKGVTHSTNAVLHPWLQAELAAILTTLPPMEPRLWTCRTRQRIEQRGRAGKRDCRCASRYLRSYRRYGCC
jgi:hypothetical protein